MSPYPSIIFIFCCKNQEFEFSSFSDSGLNMYFISLAHLLDIFHFTFFFEPRMI